MIKMPVICKILSGGGIQDKPLCSPRNIQTDVSLQVGLAALREGGGEGGH